MKVYLKNIEICPNEVSYSQLSYGKLKPFENEFKVEIERRDFIKRLQSKYDECIEELIFDDKVTGSFEPPYEGAKDYPSLEEFINIGGDDWKEFVDTFLKFDILSLFFDEDSSSAKYYVASISGFDKSLDYLVFRGNLYEK
ncbi:hypothetical protein TUMSATVNIG1_19530 [Vibrio nigripulchritudo]|uniref:hypothetical protein n=1 Tax=Vibrio nigripulchritudo TaxID=28173 RepID=UPI00190DC880|nr:hypothetical protein [Vibrio nigripulchritudo]BCL69995.1 hypothetical protein VNTUMSATTG_19320 [Vibrio nigripulchritudo]BDU31344.1 hypothetical protein TUMSATVNIG1_19530 [Vibrio nigripulchritudo]